LVWLLAVPALVWATLASDEPARAETGPAYPGSLGTASGVVTPIVSPGVVVTPITDGWRARLPVARPLGTPAVWEGQVFIGGGFGSYEFYSLDADSGRTRWAITVSDDGPTAAVVSNGMVAFNTESCTLFVVRAGDGSQVWSRWLGDPLMSQPAIADGRVFMAYPAGATHLLAAFDLATGMALWSAPLDTDIISAPVAVDGEVYVASQGGQLYRFEAATGTLRWSRSQRLTSAPWIVGGQIFAALHDETATDTAGPVEGVGALSTEHGERAQALGTAWARTPAPWLSGEVQRRSAYGGQNNAFDDAVGFKPALEGLDKTPKEGGGWEPEEWLAGGDPNDSGDGGESGGAPEGARLDVVERNLGQATVCGVLSYQGSRPLVVGSLAIATMGDTVRAVNIESGETVWSFGLPGDVVALGGHLGSPPVHASGWLYLATTDGQLLALDPATGSQVWSYAAGVPIRSQPAVVAGRVYVGSETGEILMVDSHHDGAGDWPMWGGGPGHQP
jgi:Ca-activated chloride channel family protein